MTRDPETKKLTLELSNGEKHSGFDQIIAAVGRVPEVEELGLQEKGIVQIPQTGCIQVDEYQNTSVEGIYAVGDVCGEVRVEQKKTAVSSCSSSSFHTRIHLYIRMNIGLPSCVSTWNRDISHTEGIPTC